MLESFENNPLSTDLELQSFPEPQVVKLHHPVLLCHGYGALANLVKPSPLYDIAMLMRSHNVLAFAPNVMPYATIEIRAEQWMEVMETLCSRHEVDKLNIVAHSMGGLDIRFALSQLGAAERVASVTTVCTPHHGTSLAELALNTPEALRDKISDFLNWMGHRFYPASESDAVASAEQLTRRYMSEVFNPENPDVKGVRYYSYSAAVGKGTNQPIGVMSRYQNRHIYQQEGLNDGMVSVESARWGEHITTARLSHLEQIDLRLKDERKPLFDAFWLDVLKMLQEKGH